MKARCLARAGLLCLLIGATTVFAAEGGAFPQRPVRWITPFPPGGSIDVVGRMVGQKLFEIWGQQLIIDNRAGGGGRLGVQAAAVAPADGYTQLFTLNTSLTIDRSMFKNLPYDPDKAFIPVTIVASTSQLLVTNPALPVKSVREFIALCKARPGQVLYGTSGAGTTRWPAFLPATSKKVYDKVMVFTSLGNLGSITKTTGHCLVSPGFIVYSLKQKHCTL